MAKQSITKSRVLLVNGARTVFDTDTKSFNAVPTAKIVVDPFTLSFPDLTNKTYNYRYAKWGLPTGIDYDACRTLAMVLGQETALSDIDLGALPDGTDWLKIRLKLSRTTSPPKRWGLWDWPTAVVDNQWMLLTDNSLLIEQMDNFCRLFWVEIVSRRAVLRRRQTVGAHGIITGQIDAKWGQAVSGNPRDDGGSIACSIVNTTNYASTYTGVLEITPCSYRSPT